MNDKYLVRLVAECYAVLTQDQIEDISASMDLTPEDLIQALEANEAVWEEMKGETNE